MPDGSAKLTRFALRLQSVNALNGGVDLIRLSDIGEAGGPPGAVVDMHLHLASGNQRFEPIQFGASEKGLSQLQAVGGTQ